MYSRRTRGAGSLPLAGFLALFLLALAPLAGAQEMEEFDEGLEDLYAWGAVSSVVEITPEGEGRLLGFYLNTDQGESYEIVMDDLGRSLAKEASDRVDVVVEVEGQVSVDGLMVTILDFRMVYVDPNDEVLSEEELEAYEDPDEEEEVEE